MLAWGGGELKRREETARVPVWGGGGKGELAFAGFCSHFSFLRPRFAPLPNIFSGITPTYVISLPVPDLSVIFFFWFQLSFLLL